MKIKDEIYNNLKNDVGFSKKNAWIGDYPIINATIINPMQGTNFRVSSEYHQKFDVVWIFECNIFELIHSWRLLLDESIRLLGDSGILVVRTSDNKFGTLFGLKSFICRNPNYQVYLEAQYFLDDSTISVLKIKRLNIKSLKSKDWTFGILSNGEKNKNIIELISKLESIKRGLRVEYIVAGPEIIELNSKIKIKYIEVANDGLARISEKKNKIINEATNENVVIIHDRYQVNDDFFSGFDSFGYDFDFMTVRQLYPSGSEFPSYLAFMANKKIWESPCRIDSYDQVFEGSFLNGGLIILKKSTGNLINFNALLLHNEAEDVEIGMQLGVHGIVPRINTISSAITIGINEEYTDTFIKSAAKGVGSSEASENFLKKIILRLWLKLPVVVKNKIKNTYLYEKAKNLYHS